jgi:hypothetical protein
MNLYLTSIFATIFDYTRDNPHSLSTEHSWKVAGPSRSGTGSRHSQMELVDFPGEDRDFNPRENPEITG